MASHVLSVFIVDSIGGLYGLAGVGALPSKLFVANSKQMHVSMELTYAAQIYILSKIV